MRAIDYFNEQYRLLGAAAQRRYPSEELIRFLARRLSDDSFARGAIKILDLGCGAGVNMAMMAGEMFQVYGVDCSAQAVGIAQFRGLNAIEGDMRDIPYGARMFGAAVDVFSSYCLSTDDFKDRFLPEVRRVLKPGGWFFSLTPSVKSDAYERERRIDEWAVDGIRDERSPYYGNEYPFRFVDLDSYRGLLEQNGFDQIEIERIGRTYRNGEEYFEMLVVDARSRGDHHSSEVEEVKTSKV